MFNQFFQSSKFGGFLLLFCVLISLGVANSAYAVAYEAMLVEKIGFAIGSFTLREETRAWINDGLMAIFFLLMGLEIKREFLGGELSTLKKAALPVFAALGGMLVPASTYLIFNSGTSTASGWGIPMATDIAFALAIISMLGKSVPSSLKIFLAALAISDDLGAILVIAFFYTKQIYWIYLLWAIGVFLVLLALNYFKVKTLTPYLIFGLPLWYFVHHSGIHATISGVLLASTIPNNVKTSSPLARLEHVLTKPVNLIIMPIFALVNTNISFQSEMLDGLFSPLSLGIIIGLLVGKALGISLFSIVAVKVRLAKLPSKANWLHIIGVGLLAGIGFTMSIFIALLSFEEQAYIVQAKFSVLCASTLAGFIGFLFLKRLGINQNSGQKTSSISSVIQT